MNAYTKYFDENNKYMDLLVNDKVQKPQLKSYSAEGNCIQPSRKLLFDGITKLHTLHYLCCRNSQLH